MSPNQRCGYAVDARVGHLESQLEAISKADRVWKRCKPLSFGYHVKQSLFSIPLHLDVAKCWLNTIKFIAEIVV